MKHNNVLANVHFRKDWKNRVKTWFDQPAKKAARREIRLVKAKAVAPRPVKTLRPVVRGTTARYGGKIKLGRGFTLDELKAAGLNAKTAQGVGISVDYRRKNRSHEGLMRNVQRLQAYQGKLVVFPRKPNSSKAKAGDATKEQLAKATQVTTHNVITYNTQSKAPKSRAIRDEERSEEVYGRLRNARTVAKLWGIREKRLKEKADAAKLNEKKKAKGKN